MFWIALRPTHEEERQAWGWRALQFTPRVAFLDEALVLEVSACERLWGGRRRLLRKLFRPHEALSLPAWATGETSFVALALLRLKLKGGGAPARVPGELPVHTLTAARPSLAVLERIGCSTWGELRALPTAGLSRRFGAALVRALDQAYGAQPESHAWIALPQDFDVKLELPALACSAPELMWAGQRLLSQLQLWLQARNRGVLALELEWTLDLKRIDGKPLPPTERLEVRTAQPTQDMAHLRRLVGEHLSRTTIAAPANHLRLRSLETLPWGGVTTSLLPEDNRKGEKLHQLVERLSVRLGEANVRVPVAHEDHRPERMQEWVPARKESRKPAGGEAHAASADCIYPTWLLPHPGPLRRLTRLYRVETGWWEESGPALRDYFIASSDEAGLVWIFRERPASTGRSRWYLQGLYA
jgi:protein ImuB